MVIEDDQRSRAFLIATIAITASFALWMYSMRADVGDAHTVRVFLSLFLFQDYPAALVMLVAVPFACIPYLQTAGLHLARWAGNHSLVMAGIVALALVAGAWWGYHAHPLSMDEYAPAFQARVFAAGQLFGRLPPDLVDWLVPKGFQGYFLAVSHETGEVASIYWPGWALVLTPFTALGVAWLANPALGGLAVVLVHRLAMRLSGDPAASGLAVLLTVASPAVTANAISFYSMTAHLVCNAAFALLLLEPSPRRSMAAGLIGSLALVLHNPLPHILFAAPWLLWLAARADRWRNLPSIAAGYLPICALVGLGWPHLLSQLAPAAVTTVSSADPGLIEVWIHRLGQIFRLPALDQLEDRLMGLGKLWLWAVPGLPLIAMFGVRRAATDVRCRLLGWSAVTTLLGYLFVPFDQGHGWGFRYFHSVWFALPILAVLALAPRRDSHPLQIRGAALGGNLAGLTAACAVLSLAILTPLRVYQMENFIAAHLEQVPQAGDRSPRVVLVRWQAGYYSVDLVQNDPFLRELPLYMLSQGEQPDADMLARRFPDLVLLARNETASVWGVTTP